MTTKFAKQVYLEEFIQMKLINLVLVMSLYLLYQSAYVHQIWQDNLPWRVPDDKV